MLKPASAGFFIVKKRKPPMAVFCIFFSLYQMPSPFAQPQMISTALCTPTDPELIIRSYFDLSPQSQSVKVEK